MSPYEPPTDDGPDPDRLRDEAWDRKHLPARVLGGTRRFDPEEFAAFKADPDRAAMVDRILFVDGDPPGCKCTSRCQHPCWMRVGMTDKPCCPGCAPLPAP